MDPSAIEDEALHLPIQARARLAQRLLESLDQLTEAEANDLWLSEAERRARELDDGSVEPISSEEFERRVQARLK